MFSFQAEPRGNTEGSKQFFQPAKCSQREMASGQR